MVPQPSTALTSLIGHLLSPTTGHTRVLGERQLMLIVLKRCQTGEV